jgi:endonuclease/exonuclease/phosphatase family metal-dependent hydrolase
MNMSGLGKIFGRSGEVRKHVRIAHTNLLADCYVQKYPDAFKTSAHVGLTSSQWPDYPGEYDSELRYCGVGQDSKEVDGAGVARDVLGWRTRMSVLADRLRDFQPDIIAVTEAQQNQLDALSASLASPQSSSSAPARVITWGPIVPYGRNEEPVLTGLCVGYDAAKVVLVIQEPVMLGNTNILVATFGPRMAEGDDAHETDANDTQGTRNSKDVSELLHVVVHHNTSKKNRANPGDTHFRALVEHLQKAAIDPLVLCGDFNSPSHRSGARGSKPTPTFIQHGIDTLRLTDPWALGNGRGCETYAPPYLGSWPVRWDYVLVSGLEVVSKWVAPVRPVRNARGQVDGVGTRDCLLATVGSDHAPLGVVVRIASAREEEERK